MVFSSPLFLFAFFPLFFIWYSLTPRRFKNVVALAASLVFYAWGAPTFIFYLLGFCLLDYLLARLIDRTRGRPHWPKLLLALSLLSNIALLGYFKYANFFVGQFNALLSHWGAHSLAWTAVALPIGISFFTFHKISYVLDVYRGVSSPARSLTDFLLYIALFPQLIAGPIIRYHDVAHQLRSRSQTLEDTFDGIFRFTLGLAKKILIADVLGEVADQLFKAPVHTLPASFAWLAAVCYAFQIYFDFSGYSDMALGLGLTMGFHFRENFNQPYIADSITDFWRRWHISLSSFMKEYLYIPLGGNRKGLARTYFNLWAVFLISGIWHGASWTFVLWGAYHGFFLVLDKLFWLKASARLPRLVRTSLTFLIVLFGWILFRTESASGAWALVLRMFAPGPVPSTDSPLIWGLLVTHRVALTLAAAALISFIPLPTLQRAWRAVRHSPLPVPAVLAVRFACLMTLALLSLIFLSTARFSPFIYFRF